MSMGARITDIESDVTYRIVRRVASGGMGAVYEAMQCGTDGFEKRVAIKTLLPELSENERFVRMFINEAKLVADLVHENIVQIYQLGRCRRRVYYIVMEYVHGLSLSEFIHIHAATQSPVPIELAVFIASRIARGLAYAHSRVGLSGASLNIVHRDVSPSNVLVTTEGLPKLGDFGIAKAATNVMPSRERSFVGKLLYMAPEQARREPVDFRADVYALGLVLYELLTLAPARDASSEDLLDRVREGCVDLEPVRERLDCPELLRILERMLARDREHRYADTARLGYELEYYIYHSGYGPTVVSLEAYLRENFPYLYTTGSVPLKDGAVPVRNPVKTVPFACGESTEAHVPAVEPDGPSGDGDARG
jgi:serine/threonine protein kinase